MNKSIEKLKYSINTKIYNQFDKELMNRFFFIPVNVRDGYLFVAISSTLEEEYLNVVARILTDKYSYPIKYISLSHEDFCELQENLSDVNYLVKSPQKQVRMTNSNTSRGSMIKYVVVFLFFFGLFLFYQNYKEEERIVLTFPECSASEGFGGYGSVKACGYQRAKMFNLWWLQQR